jgi:TonB family protein
MYNPPLEKIKVAAPCTAEWRWMYGNDRVRFCSQCNLNVYNLSALTREQAQDLIRSTEGRLCVRFYRRKDGSIITQNCPQGLQAIKDKFNRTRTHIVAAILTFLGYLGILWWVKGESVKPFQPVMGNIARVIDPPVIDKIAMVNPPEMGKMIMPSTVERSEKFIRERAIFKVTPVFHSDASLEGAGSQVVVNVTISPDGKVIIAECINSNPALQGIAVEAARRWKFQPMKADGLPTLVRSDLTFRLAR